MPKQKSSRTAAKRFTFTKTGKVKHKKAYLRHLLSSKSPDRSRRLRQKGTLNRADTKNVHRMLPYGRKIRARNPSPAERQLPAEETLNNASPDTA